MKPAEVSMPSDTEVLVKRGFNAPVELVWQAYTQPDLLRRWLLGPDDWTMPICEMDVRVGGKYRWRWKNLKDGKEFGFYGEFLEVTPHSQFRHTEHYDPGDFGDSMGEQPAIVTVTFEDRNGTTLVSTLLKYAMKEDRDAALSTGMTDGMEMSYSNLDNVLTSQAA